MIKITFLGTGTSNGIPVIGCSCPVCKSSDERDKRYRSSLLVEKEDTVVIIDTGYEFRLQALRAGIRKADAVLYTHAHQDHIAGLDDLRVFTSKEQLNIYGAAETLGVIEKKYPYAFSASLKGRPNLKRNAVRDGEVFSVGGITFQSIPIMHGKRKITGYLFSRTLYATDVTSLMLDVNKDKIVGKIDTLVIGALREKPHEAHFTFKEAIEEGMKTGARNIYFTHINHENSHSDILKKYSPFACPAYDGLSLEVEG